MEKLQLKMQTLKKQKSSPLKYRNANFFGDGTVFKAKLIGILEVGEARGDRMCQEALQDLKMAIRAAGEHKQKITIHVTIEGLRLRDEKTGDSLYHHPVHKISFIAQDMTDSRAFGYIFGSPDSGHRFFGIKTDKAASQVVLAMRDLFQVVFELKKKEIELARQHIQNKITQHEHQQAIAALTNKSDPSTSSLYKNSEGKLTSKDKSPESVADLVDLEQELSSIQRGITQMERITPSEPTPKSLTDRDDPFGDSFISTPPIYNLLPPPPEASSKRNQKSSPTPKSDEPLAELAQVLSNSQAPLATDEDWLNTPPQSAASICDMHESISYGEDIVNSTNNTQDYRNLQLDVFTELDPLGTGKIRPYVDKKYFFQDLKNPPKKVLKELSQEIPSFDVYFGQDLNREYSGDRKQSRSEDFDKSFDPFQTEYDPFSGSIKSSDPFDCFPDSDPNSQDEAKVERNRSTPSSAALNGPRLQVSLPPEKTGNWDASPRPEKSDGTSPIPQGIVRNRPIASSRSSAMDFVNTLGTGKRSHFFDAGSRGHQDIETEAPEPPPRPDSVGNLEPPPLPPKKQFSDIVIRPSSAISNSNSSNNDSLRSDFMHERRSNQDDNAPPLPLPSRKVVSSRIHQKKLQEDDYLTPLSGDIPTLLPPPQKKDPLKVVRKSEKKPEPPSTDLAEMSVSRLLSLGIDELAKKLNVPVSKVSNMTLVELSMYLTDFIENSKKQQQQQQQQAIEKQSAIFKVNFDAASFGNESTFFAKFDDNFGEETDQKFVADFERFKDVKPEVPPPSADRYAVLREIIEQELQVQKRTPEPVEVEEKVEDKPVCVKKTLDFEKEVEAEISRLSPNLKVGNVEPIPRPLSKIDAKMSEALSQGKDRYAALRDIVLVEDLFDKPGAQDVFFDSSEDQPGEDYPEINILDDNMGIEPEKGGRDDLEINDYLQEAVSSMSLNREHLSPISKSPGFSQLPVQQNASTSPIKLQNTSKSPTLLDPGVHKMNDMSTSPIPIDKPVTPHKIPSPLSPKSLRTASPLRKDEIRDEQSKVRTESGSQSDVVSESSPETDDKVHRTKERAERSESNNNHSWAVFDGPTSPKHEKKETPKEPKRGNKGKVSPCSSEGKDDWKEEPEYGGSRRVKAAAHNTSSSSRDQSPWEEENSDFRRDRRDRYGYPPGRRAHRRKNSCDEDYDYPEYDRPQRRKEHPWSPPEDYDDFEPRSCWSPSEQEERRNFDRYERSPYAEPKSLNTYDRRDYSKYYDKRKYYRERNRMDFPYEEPYEDVHEPPVRGKRNNYENVYEFDRSSRDARRDHFYNKETRSFESTESFDSRGRPNSFGSGEIYGSYDREYRDRYVMEKNRLLKGRNARSKPDLEQDSDTEFGGRRERFESSSLQRGRPKPGEDKRSWKRPGSATEPGQRRLPPNVGAPPEPESEKDRRFRRKGRLMRKEDDYVSNYATMRYAPRRRDDYYDYDPEEDPYYSQYYKTAGPRLEGRSETSKDKRYDYPETDERRFKKSASREFFEPKERFAKFPEEKKHVRVEFDSPSKAGGNGKFNFEDVGFDSDFSPAFGTPQNNSKGFKFAADFEEKSRQNFAPSPSSRQTFAPSPSNRQNFANFENFPSPVPAPAPPSASKLRFNENVQVSKFDANTASSNMFEDNFSKTELDEKADQWNEMAAPPKMRQLRSPHENLKKSESVNIFVKKQDDPFEDDPFFGSSAASNQNNNINSKKSAGDNWNKNFANFDNNM